MSEISRDQSGFENMRNLHSWGNDQGETEQEAVLKATAVRSPLPVMLLILPCPPCLPQVM